MKINSQNNIQSDLQKALAKRNTGANIASATASPASSNSPSQSNSGNTSPNSSNRTSPSNSVSSSSVSHLSNDEATKPAPKKMPPPLQSSVNKLDEKVAKTPPPIPSHFKAEIDAKSAAIIKKSPPPIPQDKLDAIRAAHATEKARQASQPERVNFQEFARERENNALKGDEARKAVEKLKAKYESHTETVTAKT